jgi:membrane protease YdiL (CAAX protease family)
MRYDDSNPAAPEPDQTDSGNLPGGNVTSQEASSSPATGAGPEVFPPPPHFDPSVPEDLRVPWGWIDLGLFIVFGIVSSLVLAGVTIGIAIAFFGAHPRDFTGSAPSTARAIFVVVTQALWSIGALLYLFVMVHLRTSESFWRTIGWHRLRTEASTWSATVLKYMASGAVLAVAVSFAGKFVGQPEELPIEQMFRTRVAVMLLMTFGILLAPLVEETLFRGFLYPVIARRFGIPAGVIVTGILFGAMHAEQLWGGWGQIGLLIAVGIVLTWVRARSGTVVASYLMHLGYNTLLFLGFFAATGGLKHIPGGQ